VELDADGAGSFDRFEIDFFAEAGDRLSNGVQSRGKCRNGPQENSEAAEPGARRGAGEAAQKDQREDKKSDWELFGEGPSDPFQNVFNSAPMYIYRIPKPISFALLWTALKSLAISNRPPVRTAPGGPRRRRTSSNPRSHRFDSAFTFFRSREEHLGFRSDALRA